MNPLKGIYEASLHFRVRARRITAYEVGKQLFATGLRYDLTDRYYWTVPKGQMRALAATTGLRKIRYLEDRRDCNDYADLLQVILMLYWGVTAVGVIQNDDHAWNLAVCTDGLMHVEPQTGMAVAPGTGLYTLEKATIWL